MADTLALINLFDKSTTDLQANTAFDAIEVKFGWKEPARQKTAHAIVIWVPGNEGGSAGKIISARYPGRNPRPVGTLDELFTVICAAYDPTNPEDERTQYITTRMLFDEWYASVYRTAHGTFAIDSVDWVSTKLERRFGTSIRITGRIQAMIPDIASADAAPATAHTTYTLLPADAAEG